MNMLPSLHRLKAGWSLAICGICLTRGQADRGTVLEERGALQGGAAGFTRAKRLCGRLGRTLEAATPPRDAILIGPAAGASRAYSFARPKPAAPRLAANGQTPDRLKAGLQASLGLQIALIVGLVLHANGSIAASANEPDGNPSPRLAALVRELQAGNSQALSNFWKGLDGTPFIEPMATNERQRCVTFLWRAGDQTTRVTMMGGLPSPNILKPLRRLENSDLWYLTEMHAIDARFQYMFHINGPEALRMEHLAIMSEMKANPPRRDPLNAREYAGWSYVELPNAPPQPVRRFPLAKPRSTAGYPLTSLPARQQAMRTM